MITIESISPDARGAGIPRKGYQDRQRPEARMVAISKVLVEEIEDLRERAMHGLQLRVLAQGWHLVPGRSGGLPD